MQQSHSSIKEGNLHFHSSSLCSFLKHHSCWLDTYMHVTKMIIGSISNVKWTQLILIICYLLGLHTPTGATYEGRGWGLVVQAVTPTSLRSKYKIQTKLRTHDCESQTHIFKYRMPRILTNYNTHRCITHGHVHYYCNT